MTDITPANDRELVLTRLVDVSAEKLYRCWTEPALLVQWFAPAPWTTPSAELDVRAGGASLVTMRSPEGVDMPNPGMYLEVVPNRKLVFTDAFSEGWYPAGAPFMVVELTFTPEGDKTRYTARAALDQGGHRAARGHGLPRGLGHLRRPARGAGEDPLTP